MSNRKCISDFDSEIIKMASEGKSNRQIAIQIGINPSSLAYRVKQLGLTLRNGKFTPENKEQENLIINLYKSGKSYKDISKELNIPIKRISPILTRNNIEIRTNVDYVRMDYPISKTAFSDFTESEAVYWYGWLVTDGCITDSDSVSLSLKREDSYIIEKFKEYIGSNSKVNYKDYFHKQQQKNQQVTSFSFSDRVTAEKLKLQGLSPRKSCKEVLPKFDWLYSEVAPVFWRAIMEGDGYISDVDTRHSEISLVGSEELLLGFRKFCEVICKVDVGKELKTHKKAKNPNYRTLTYSGVNARKVVAILWSHGDIFLKRKKLRADKMLAKHNK